MTIIEKLRAIQTEMKAPKNLRNTFGGYNYRNAEGILEAFKHFEVKYNVALIVSDTVEAIGGRVYVRAEARLYDTEDKEADAIIASAFAREADEKKGMDAAQITGAASSYARKYALNGMFLLDDTKDADSIEYQADRGERSQDEHHIQSCREDTEQFQGDKGHIHAGSQKIAAEKVRELLEDMRIKGITVHTITTAYHVGRMEDLDNSQFEEIKVRLENTKAKITRVS